MKMVLLAALLVLFLVGSVASFAVSEGVYTTDTAVRLVPGSDIGATVVYVWADADANVQFFWKDYSQNPAVVTATSPDYALRSAMTNGRKFVFNSGADSMYVDIATTGEVIASW